jgi:hypothetical protein
MSKWIPRSFREDRRENAMTARFPDFALADVHVTADGFDSEIAVYDERGRNLRTPDALPGFLAADLGSTW